jgi:hypothetical protein
VSLYRIKVPTGDPKCPPEVRRAKFILEEIKKKVDLSEGEEDLEIGGEEGEDTISSAAGYTREADGDRTGTARSDGDFDGDRNNLSGGEDNEDEGEEMSLRDANNSTNDIVAPSSNEVNESVHRVPTIARRKRQVLVAAALAAEAAVIPPPSLGVVIEIESQGRVPNELVAMLTTRMTTSPCSSS